ncbi:MAG: ABC transporter substrate-binding protein, partial [Clostridia bacterium]|nr:ABC transporter substrate-binding protein [Clostridia bacterium]
YQDYLSRSGEDDGEHYAVKIEATELLLDNIENTFVTPVFNGSASLRDAAGHLIENTAKSVRRKETIDEAYFGKLYDDVRSLYRLDQLGGQADSGREDLGPLPSTSVALLSGIGAVWLLMGAYLLSGIIRKKMEENRGKT